MLQYRTNEPAKDVRNVTHAPERNAHRNAQPAPAVTHVTHTVAGSVTHKDTTAAERVRKWRAAHADEYRAANRARMRAARANAKTALTGGGVEG